MTSEAGACGDRWLVVGNSFEAGGTQIGFLGDREGRTPEPVEQQTRPEGRTGGVRHSWPADYPERARELHAQGLSCPRVAEELGVPLATAKFLDLAAGYFGRETPVPGLEPAGSMPPRVW